VCLPSSVSTVIPFAILRSTKACIFHNASNELSHRIQGACVPPKRCQLSYKDERRNNSQGESLKPQVSYQKLRLNSVAWVRERTIPTERPPLASKVSANFCSCNVVRVTDPYCRILAFLARSRYFFVQVAPQLNSRGWAGLVPDPLLLRKSDSTGNPTRTYGSVARNSNH
jgi:hypothetical protein